MARSQSQSQARLTINIDNLIQIRNMLEKPVIIKTGLFADSDHRTDGKSNIAIGADHEFGRPDLNLPMRSWLRLPFFLKKKNIEDVAKSALTEGIKKKSMKGFYDKIAAECLHIVRGAFATGGYGHWQQLSDQTIARKGHDIILRDTDQLMGGVESRVVK